MAVITMRDIARQAAVSQATVSLVLNDRKSSLISEATRDRVQTVARELGYRPNQNARALARGKTDTIGLWIKSFHSTYYMQFLHELDQIVTRDGYSLIVSRNTTLQETSSIMQSFPMQSVDGIIAVDIPETVEHFNRYVSATPLVNLGSQYSGTVDYVAAELTTGTQEAIRHLIGRGRRTIALLIDTPSHGMGGGEREAAYHAVMLEAGLPPEIIFSVSQAHEDAGNAVRARLQTGRPLDAIFCYNDDMAIGANRGLRDAGRRMPEDVALVGCDNITEAAYMEPPLSTIGQPRAELCSQAWLFLQNRMREPQMPIQSAILSGHFIPRASS